MEQIIKTIIENYQIVIQYACMFLAYFLVFLFRSKVNTTRTNLTLAYKSSEAKLREDFDKEVKTSKGYYDTAVDQISDLQKDVCMLKNTVSALIGGNDEKTSTITDENADV